MMLPMEMTLIWRLSLAGRKRTKGRKCGLTTPGTCLPGIKTNQFHLDLVLFLFLSRTEEGKAVAFSHFRYDMDYDDEVPADSVEL